MTKSIIIAGSGGQGIMLIGKVLAQAAMDDAKFVTWLPAYGAEVRGGTAHCMVIISDAEIGSPCVEKADVIIAMNQLSFNKFKNQLNEKGILIVNSSLAKVNSETKALKFPFTEIAINLGNIKVANMVALGALLGKKKIVPVKNIVNIIKQMAPADRPELITVNQAALNKGLEL
ncbi:MAG: 2-oxoacid:acceptor oxidoreductase family protein [Candidatus Omnitrophica bacterium]|nr:2-oxoacid:acceptor oxidoreductase family protein [Candidatus Omnitrophota bacterium]